MVSFRGVLIFLGVLMDALCRNTTWPRWSDSPQMTLCFRKFISSVGPGRFVLPMTDPVMSSRQAMQMPHAQYGRQTPSRTPWPWLNHVEKFTQITWNMCFFVFPIGSMYGIYTYIWLIFMVNVGKYTIHGSYGFEAIDDETFTPSIHPSLKTPRILRSFNTEWSNTSCTSAKACRNGELLHTPGLPNISPQNGHIWVDDFPNFPFGGICDRSLEGTGYSNLFSWSIAALAFLFCKISRRSVKTFVEGGPNINTHKSHQVFGKTRV